MSDVAVSKVVLTIGKKEIALSLEEAKELRNILNVTFGERVVEKEEHHHHHDYYRPQYRWQWPAYQWPVPYTLSRTLADDLQMGSAWQGSLQNGCLNLTAKSA